MLLAGCEGIERRNNGGAMAQIQRSHAGKAEPGHSENNASIMGALMPAKQSQSCGLSHSAKNLDFNEFFKNKKAGGVYETLKED